MAVEKVIIIGSGPAAWTAAIYAARGNLQPLVFEGAQTEENRVIGTTPLGQLSWTTEVENFPGWPAGEYGSYLKSALPPEHLPYWLQDGEPQPLHAIQGPELMNLMRQQAKNFGTRVTTDDVTKLELGAKPFTLHTRESGTHQAHAVIVATGARANWLSLPSEETYKNRGVSACAVCDGALPRFRDKPVAVVGGGDSAIEEASHMAKFASRVFLIHRRDEFRASQIMRRRVQENPKITAVLNAEVEKVVGDDDGVTGVELRGRPAVRRGGELAPFGQWLQEHPEFGGHDGPLPVAGMFVAIGHTPNTKFLDGQLELTEKNYIKLKEPGRTYTSVEGVFAAGDVFDDHYRQAITAAGSGCMAALDAERWLTHYNLV